MSDSARLQASVNMIRDAAMDLADDVRKAYPRGRKDGEPSWLSRYPELFHQLAFELERDARPFTD